MLVMRWGGAEAWRSRSVSTWIALSNQARGQESGVIWQAHRGDVCSETGAVLE